MGKIAFQGEPGANSHIACQNCYPDMDVMACATFEQTFAALRDGAAALAMIPVENTVAGRVADIHRLLPGSGLYITGEHFMRVNHCLLGLKGASVDTLTHVHSHEMALGQCRNLIGELDLKPMVSADTAGAARELAEANVAGHGAIASKLAAKFTGLMCCAKISKTVGKTRHVFSSCRPAPMMPCPKTATSSPALFSACAMCRPRSTRRWAVLPPIMST